MGVGQIAVQWFKPYLSGREQLVSIADKRSDFRTVAVFSSFFFFRKNYLLLSYATSVRLSVRPSVRLSVRPSVEIISFRGNSLPNRPIELKIGMNVRERVVHVRKAWFFEILVASCKFMQFAIFCK